MQFGAFGLGCSHQAFDNSQLLCGGPRGKVLEGDARLYFDDNHLSMTGAAKVAPAVLRLLEVKTTATAAGPGFLR